MQRHNTVRSPLLSDPVVESSPDGMFAFDGTYRYTVWNGAMERLTGIDRRDCLGQPAFEVFPLLKANGEDRHYAAALEGRTETSARCVFRSGEPGPDRVFEVRYAPLYDPQGRVVGGMGVLRESAPGQPERYRDAFEQAPIPMVEIGDDGRLRAANRAYCALSGYSAAELSAQPAPSILLAGAEERDLEAWQALVGGAGEGYEREQRYVSRDGRARWVKLYVRALHDPAGGRYYLAQVLDVDGWRAAQREAERRETIMRLGEELTRVGSWEWEADTGRVIWSEGMYRLFGYEPGTVEPTIDRVMQHVDPAHHALLYEAMGRQEGTPVVRGADFVVHLPDGRMRHLRGMGVRQRSPDDGRVRIIGATQDVTEQRQIEEALNQTSERFVTVFHAVPIGIVLVTRDTLLIKEVNEHFVALAGASLVELVGLEFDQSGLLDASGLAALQEQLHAPEAARHDVEVVLRQKNGSRRDVLLSFARIGPGEASDLLLLFTDITDRKAIEDAWRDAQEWIRLIMDQIPLAISWKNRDLRYLGANRVALAGMGKAEMSEVVGLGEADLPWTPEEAESFQAWDQQVVDTGKPVHFVIESMHRADGTVGWFKTNRVPLRDAEGRVVGLLVTREDIAGLIEAGEQLRESEERYRSFVETISEAICCFELVPPVRTYKPVEAQARALFERACLREYNAIYAGHFGQGEAPEEIMGWHMELLHPWTDTLRMVLVNFVESGYKLQNARYAVEQADGATRHYLVNMAGMVLHGQVERIWLSAIDITESYELQSRLVDLLERQLQRLGRDLHDGVGQLLTGVRMMGDQLEELLRQEGHACAVRASRIASFAQAALEQTRNIYQGLTPVQLQYEGLSAALESLASKTQEGLEVRCTFTADAEADVADTERALHLYRIAQEAINNAIRHGKARHLSIALRKEESMTLLQIEDDGVGFDAATLQHRGLGLNGMRYRADAIGAWLQVTSEPGRGTVVRCLLPRAL